MEVPFVKHTSGFIDKNNVNQVIAACINGVSMTLVSVIEDPTSVALRIIDCNTPSLEYTNNIETITFNKEKLSDDQLNMIRSLDKLYCEEQNRLCLEMIKQPGAHVHEYPASITIWNRVPDRKEMTSRSFTTKDLYEETLKIVRSCK